MWKNYLGQLVKCYKGEQIALLFCIQQIGITPTICYMCCLNVKVAQPKVIFNI